MAHRNYPFIAREGWPLLVVLVVGGALVHRYVDPMAAVPVWGLLLLTLFMFRDPNRDVPPSPLAVVSPADGRVVAIENRRDPYLDRDAVWISINMSRMGVFSTRSPVEGKALQPPRLPTPEEYGTRGPVPHGVWLQTDEEDAVIVVMNRGPLHNPPRCYIQLGQRVGQGQRCGFIHFGARIEVILPCNARIQTKVGDRLSAGEDVIATLVNS